MRRAWLIPGLVAIALSGCSGKTTVAGLEVVLSTNLTYPAQYDYLFFEVDQLDASGKSTRRGGDKGFTPVTTPLPATYAIAPGGPNETAQVTFRATKNGIVVDSREIIVQLPTDRVAELAMALTTVCYRHPTCAMGSSCDPATGNCVSDTIAASSLPTYDGGGLASDGGVVSDARGPDGSRTDATMRDSGKGDSTASHDTGKPVDAAPLVTDGPLPEATAHIDGGCEGGPCAATVFATTSGSPNALAVDDLNGNSGNLYWSIEGSPDVWSCPVTGCGVGGPKVFTTAPANVVSLAGFAFTPGLYWAYDTPDSGSIAGCQGNPCSGGVSLPQLQPAVNAVLSWPTLRNDFVWSTGHEVRRCGTGGSCAQPEVIGLEPGGSATLLASDNSDLYWLNPRAGLVEEAQLTVPDGGPRGLVVSRDPDAGAWEGIGLGEVAVYWTEPERGRVQYAPHGGSSGESAPATLYSGGTPRGLGLFYNSPLPTYVYWADSKNGAIMAVPDLPDFTSAITVKSVVTGIKNPRIVLVDGVNVYWTEDDDGIHGGKIGVISREATDAFFH